jgi:hypothetical protein
MKRFLLIILLAPCAMVSQNKRIVFAEGGTSVNQSFYPNENTSGNVYGFCGNGYTIGTYNKTINRETTASFYSKVGIETPIVRKKHFSFSIPLALGYREQKENFISKTDESYFSGATSSFSIKTQSYSQILSLVFGPKAAIDFKKWSFFTSVNMNTQFCFYNRSQSFSNFDFGTYKNISTDYDNDVMFNLSSQNGILYNLNEKLSIGLSADVFFYNFNPTIIKYNKKDNHLFNLGYGTNSAIINTGARVQYSF